MNRPYLVDLAFAMLRGVGAAEDAVQEAFARLAVTDFDSIEDKRGWLIVVTSRICLNQINSARSRREQAHETSTIEFVGPPTSRTLPVDPVDRVTLDDVKAFAHCYYVPSNATLVLVGDFDRNETIKSVNHWFGSLPKSDPPVRVSPATVPIPRRLVASWPSVPDVSSPRSGSP